MIPIIRPHLGDDELRALERVIGSGWLTSGNETQLFEREFAQVVGAKYACAVSNCTTALHLALLAVGVSEGDEVITVSHSFIATANVIRHIKAVPRFVDVNPDTFNINTSLIAAQVTRKTKALLVVHQAGMPCEINAVLKIAKTYNLPVVEDAACALGSLVRSARGRWEPIGKPHGDVACFSFHPRKILTTGEGGMITSKTQTIDNTVRRLREHCMSKSSAQRHESHKVSFESYPEVGFNYRFTDLQAAIGRVQLTKLNRMVQERRKLAERYKVRLSEINGVRFQHEDQWAKSNWQSFIIRLPEWIHQKKIMQRLLEMGIATRRGVMNAHMEKAYSRSKAWCPNSNSRCLCVAGRCKYLNESEIIRDGSIIIPLYESMRPADQEYIIKTLGEILK